MRSSSRPPGIGGRSSAEGTRSSAPGTAPGDGWDLWPAARTVGGREITARYLVDASGGRLALGERRARWAPSTTALHGRWPIAGDMSDVVDFGARMGVGALHVGSGAAVTLSSCCSSDSRSLVGVSPRARRSCDTPRWCAARFELGAGSEPSSLGSCDATPMWSRQPVGPISSACGDAALSLDPLSSDGVRQCPAVCAARCRGAPHHCDPTAGRPLRRSASWRAPRSAPSATTIESPPPTTRRQVGRTSSPPRTGPTTGRRTDAASAGSDRRCSRTTSSNGAPEPTSSMSRRCSATPSTCARRCTTPPSTIRS